MSWAQLRRGVVPDRGDLTVEVATGSESESRKPRFSVGVFVAHLNSLKRLTRTYVGGRPKTVQSQAHVRFWE